MSYLLQNIQQYLKAHWVKDRGQFVYKGMGFDLYAYAYGPNKDRGLRLLLALQSGYGLFTHGSTFKNRFQAKFDTLDATWLKDVSKGLGTVLGKFMHAHCA